MARTVVAIYDDFSTANNAVRELVDAGFARDNISIIANNSGATGTTTGTTGENVADETGAGAGVGAGIGAAIGGIGGLLVGLGALTIPGIGPVIAAGPLAVALSTLTGAGVGAVAGGVTGGLLGALIGLGIPQEEAEYYAEGVRRGGVLVTVQADDYNTEQIMDILNRHEPMDINDRAIQWRSEGWTGFDPNAPAYTRDDSPSVHSGPNFDAGGMGAGMQSADTGYSATDPGTLQRGSVAGAGPVDTGAGVTGEDITGESMTGRGAFGSHEVRDSSDRDLHEMRDRNAQMGQTNMGDSSFTDAGNAGSGMDETVYRRGASGTNDYDTFNMENPIYRNHYNTYLVDSGYPYDYYVPAYQYGYGLASDVRYQHRSWDVVERDVQRDWELEHPGTWDRFKNAIRHAWEDVSGQNRDMR